MQQTILITGAGGPAGKALGEQFRFLNAARESRGQTPYTVVGADIDPQDNADYTAVMPVPRADDPAAMQGLHALATRVRADLIIPTVADELAQVAVVADLMGAPVVISGAQGAALTQDKWLTMWALEQTSIPIPTSGLPSQFCSVQTALEELEGPLVLKPRNSRGGRGVRVVDSPAGLGDGEQWADLPDSLVVQAFADGQEYNPQVYRSPHTGKVDVVVLRKTALAQGRVGNAVSTQRLARDEALDVAHIAAHAAEALDLTGPMDMDIRRTSGGQPVVLEINARFGANSSSAPELLTATLSDYLGD